MRSTSLFYKILLTILGACKPTFYIIYTSHLRWNSIMRRYTDLGQQNACSVSQYCDTNCYSGRSKHAWALAVNRWKNFQNHLYGQPVVTFTVLAVASVWMNRVTLQHNKEFIMFIFYFKTVNARHFEYSGNVVTKTRNDLQWPTMIYNDLQWSTMSYYELLGAKMS